ncbi:DUF5683 domain-containing protein [Salinimicrobium terrae]|uniref:DUF5683 domain-containing protein n=1 Tax=Salinimicrobium terrae TaxID=470866 RepID=UPI0004111616|nr:DUF5683 domain-containing protein [Salinimicrobium terrae]
MKIKNLIVPLLFCLFSLQLSAQDDSLLIDPQLVIEEPAYKPYDPLSPARAAFYSAVLPGLGQAYNGKYWKIPIVYTALGVGVYFYLENDRQYDRYRSAYKSRLAGNTDDEFYDENGQPRVSTSALIEAQRFYQRNKEVSVLVTLGLYALNIIDANVDAHLQQFNVSEDLSLKPNLDYNQFTGTTGYGLTLNYNF